MIEPMFELQASSQVGTALGHLAAAREQLSALDLTGLSGGQLLDLVAALEIDTRQRAAVTHALIAEVETRGVAAELGSAAFCRRTRGAGMQVIVTWLCAALGLSALIPGAAAENACPPNALGVSRTAEIDTTGGPWFGSPRGDKDFLAPGEVVLTFDDGPTPRNSRTILAALAAHCTKATFFMLGEMAAEYPSLVKEIATLGHTILTIDHFTAAGQDYPEGQVR